MLRPAESTGSPEARATIARVLGTRFGIHLLAAEGQRALRDAHRERVQALRDLKKLARLVTGPPAELFAAWLAQIRAQGLPADRLPGLTPEQVQEAQAEILALDPREAALTHYRAQADLRVVDSKPPDDAEWDLAASAWPTASPAAGAEPGARAPGSALRAPRPTRTGGPASRAGS